MSKHRAKNRLPPFVPLLINTLDAPAWHATSHGAKVLYIALRRRYSVHNHNNGRIFLSQRVAAKELRSHHNEIARWFRELQHYGFIVMTAPGFLGVQGKGKAPRWRLTELGSMTNPPTRDFTHWNGAPFKNKKTKARAAKPARSVPGSTHTSVPVNRATVAKTVQGTAHISKSQGVQGNRHRASLPYAGAQTPTAPLAVTTPLRGSFGQLTRPKRIRPRLRQP
jgi:hypothetical protein